MEILVFNKFFVDCCRWNILGGLVSWSFVELIKDGYKISVKYLRGNRKFLNG